MRLRGIQLPERLAPRFQTAQIFQFEGPQGKYMLTGPQVLEAIMGNAIKGPAKHAAVRDLLALLTDSRAGADELAVFGETPEMRAASLAHINDTITQLEAVAAMENVDAFINFPDSFIEIMLQAPGSTMILKYVDEQLNAPLKHFFAVCGPGGDPLNRSYSSASDALERFRCEWVTDPAGALESLQLAMSQLR